MSRLLGKGSAFRRSINGVMIVAEEGIRESLTDQVLGPFLESLPYHHPEENGKIKCFLSLTRDPQGTVKLLEKLEPEPQEISIVITDLEAPVPKVFVHAGSQVLNALNYARENIGGTNVHSYITSAISQFGLSAWAGFLSSGSIEGQSFAQGVAMARLASLVTLVTEPVRELMEEISKMPDISVSLRSILLEILLKIPEIIRRSIDSAEADHPELSDLAEQLFDKTIGEYGWLIEKFSLIGFAVVHWNEVLSGYSHLFSLFIKLNEADKEFSKGVDSVTKDHNRVSETLERFQEDFSKHRPMMEDLADYSFLGGMAFFVGTLVQIVLDIINAIVMLVKFFWYGFTYSASSLFKIFSAPSNEQFFNLSSDFLSLFYTEVDLDELVEDTEEMIRQIIEFGYRLSNSFIENATEYGKAYGEFLMLVADNPFTLGSALVFEEHKASFTPSERLWWAIEQYFNLGRWFGPMIADFITMFFGGSGVISAASKVGKFDALSDVLRLGKYTTEKIQSLSKLTVVTKLLKLVPQKLGKLVTKWMEIIQEWVTPIVDRVMGLARKLPDPPNAKELEEIGETLQDAYDTLELYNFLVFIALISGLVGISDKDGAWLLELAIDLDKEPENP